MGTEEAPGNPWSARENAVLVREYLEMLASQFRGEQFVKAERLRAIADELHARNRKAIEFKHMNVSHVLRELGPPYVDGYKPAPHTQRDLSSAVEDGLSREPELLELLERQGFGGAVDALRRRHS